MIKIYDTTLRDGAQMEGMSFTTADKLKIAQKLIDFGVDYIEGGFPGSNPRDTAFFQEAKKLQWGATKLVAFCATRHKTNKPAADPGLQGVIQSEAKFTTVFGKTWTLHTEKILGITKKENLALIESTIKFLRQNNIEVFFDAEHFFDGFFADQDFALECLKTAAKVGAQNLTLCDTNGGMLPWQIEKAVKEAKKRFPKISLGIHTHNDSGMAEANTIVAVKSGVDLVQGTINGYGERTGNANLCVVLPNLALKMNENLAPKISLAKLTALANSVAEIANTTPPKRAPFVGQKSFVHKAGVHVAAVAKIPESYEHLDPALVGNMREITVSELSGRANIMIAAQNLGFKIDKNSDLAKKILARVKEQEAKGLVYEGAEAGFALLLARLQDSYKTPFELVDFLILDRGSRHEVEAEVQIKVKTKIHTAIAFGNGPVNALDKALRAVLTPAFPVLKKMQLLDYKVRILDSKQATGAATRVLIESNDGSRTWTTVGCGENITKASLDALLDALEYAILF